jgi:hypothetical protein
MSHRLASEAVFGMPTCRKSGPTSINGSIPKVAAPAVP